MFKVSDGALAQAARYLEKRDAITKLKIAIVV